MRKVEIHADYVQRIMDDLSIYGSDGGTGITRTVYSPAWVEATEAYARWCAEAGLVVRRDAVGSVWGRLDGSLNGPAIVSGSHIDSQTAGGRFDGTLGAVAGLVAVRSLKDQFGTPRLPIEAVALCEEESSRFPSAEFWGSRAIVGRISEQDTYIIVYSQQFGYLDRMFLIACLIVVYVAIMFAVFRSIFAHVTRWKF